MKTHNASNWLGLTADLFLFLSALLMLIDFAPRDLSPKQRERIRAVETLRSRRPLLGELPVGLDIKHENPSQKTYIDPSTVSTLIDLIKQKSNQTEAIEWNRIVGVGYSSVKIPVAQNSLEAIRPLYITLIPRGNGTRFEISPVGTLEDLDRWLEQWHRSSLTFTAAIVLATGFALQLSSRLISWREKSTPQKTVQDYRKTPVALHSERAPIAPQTEVSERPRLVCVLALVLMITGIWALSSRSEKRA